MRVLCLGPTSPLFDWLGKREPIERVEHKITPAECEGFDWLVSYGYRHILKADVLDMFPNRAINIHTSYLPWNRGAHPNFWSWLDDTPKGVTIHYIDEGIDTGDIIFQVPVDFSGGNPTLAESYRTLGTVATKMFQAEWPMLVAGLSFSAPQRGEGSYHRKKDMREWDHLLADKGWDTPCSEIHR